jgi:hypothetical protein
VNADSVDNFLPAGEFHTRPQTRMINAAFWPAPMHYIS